MTNKQLENRVEERTRQLEESNETLRREILRRERVEESLRESEMRFRSHFELGLVGSAITSPDKAFLEVNDKFTEIFGYHRRELLQMKWIELVHPDDLANGVGQFERLVAGKIDSYAREGRYLRKDGQEFRGMISVACQRKAGGSVLFVMAHLQDITDRKRSEEKILTYQEQLRSMASEISLVEERERRKIAIALHDQVGQVLALSSMKLGHLRYEVESPEAQEQIKEIREMIGEAIRQSRTLTYELSPPILYDLGLEAAICSLGERYQKQHGIRIHCSYDQEPKPISDDMRTLLFQGVRELIVNAVKHAQAQSIFISCRREGSEVAVVVEDDGIGFVATNGDAWHGKDHGFGLFSIRERLRYLGGDMAIRSAPGKGTEVELTAPLDPEPKD